MGVLSQKRIMYFCRPLGAPDHDRCNALGRAAGSVSVLEWRDDPSGYIWSIDGPRRYVLESFRRRRGWVDYCYSVLGLINSAVRGCPDIAIFYDYQAPPFFIVAVILRMRGVNIISLNDSKFDDFSRSILKDIPKAIVLSVYKNIIAASTRAADYAHYLGRRRTSLYYCAIDTHRITDGACDKLSSVKYDERAFVMIARLMQKKNHRALLRAYETYALRSPTPRKLLLCGYGPLEDEIRAQIAASVVLPDLVELRGYVAGSDVPGLLGANFALVLPSTEEQFGIVVTEALAAGLPVLISSQCGATDIVTEGRTGHIVNAKDEQQIADALQKLGELSEDEWRSMNTLCITASRQADVASFVAAVEVFV